MKKLFVLIAALALTITLSACSSLGTNEATQELSSKNALVSLSYLSAGFLDVGYNNVTASTTGFDFQEILDNHEEPTTEFETELEDVNIYLEKLKGFIENGTEGFGNVQEQASDRVEFDQMLVITVQEEDYVLYYSIDEFNVITGVFVIGDVDYVIEATSTLEDTDELDEEETLEELEADLAQLEAELLETQTALDAATDEQVIEDLTEEVSDLEEEIAEVEDDILNFGQSDDEDDDDEEEENEQKMELIATNGMDSIKITYKVEQDSEEQETKFEIEKNIAGEVSELSVKISQEEDEYKVTVEEDGNEYSFKVETEDGETMYKLQYRVNGVQGQVKIRVEVDENGEEFYAYQIIEQGKEASARKGRPESFGWNDDDEDEVEEETETEE